MAADGSEMTDLVTAVRMASDRARNTLYVTIIATVLILAASYNTYHEGWPIKRLQTWYEAIKQLDADPGANIGLGNNDPDEIRRLREAYLREFVSRAVFTTSPLPGVSIDVNNLGFFGGVTLILLMIVVVASMSAEHESVFIALQEISLIGTDTTKDADLRRRDADRLYHALVMTQVLGLPPTRARWKRHRVFLLARIIFFVPALVYTWVVWAEWAGRHVTARYGADPVPILITEACMLAVLLALSIVAWLHSRAIAIRWREAFFVVNPQYQNAAQQTLRQWLRIGRSGSAA